MEKQRLTTFGLSLKNLKKRSLRTKSLIVVVAVFTFAVFCGALLTQSLKLGKNYISGRMGADIMIVPRGCALNFQDTLLKSKANTFYMNENLTEDIADFPGVEQVSPQLYIASLNASCCTVPVQLIGFDPKTDFTIQSWMKKSYSSKLGFGEVVTGSHVNTPVGEQVWFFGQPLKVMATLDDSGMGFDSSIFMTLQTAQHMIELSGQTAIHPAGTGKEKASAVFIKLTNDADAPRVANTIINSYPLTDVVLLKDMTKHLSEELNNIKGLVYGIQGFLLIVSILILTIVFTFTTNERKREFGLLLSLGATRKKLIYLIVTETSIISVLGAVCGVMAAALIMFDFRMMIAVSLGLPYIQPKIGAIILLVAISLLISVFTGVIACLYSVIRIGRLETQILIREHE